MNDKRSQKIQIKLDLLGQRVQNWNFYIKQTDKKRSFICSRLPGNLLQFLQHANPIYLFPFFFSPFKIFKYLLYTKLHTSAQLLVIRPLYLIYIPYKLNFPCVLVSYVTCFSLRPSEMSIHPDKLHSQKTCII